LTIHSTMNSDIIEVTKSAYATFQAPPWWPCPTTFLMTMMGCSGWSPLLPFCSAMPGILP